MNPDSIPIIPGLIIAAVLWLLVLFPRRRSG